MAYVDTSFEQRRKSITGGGSVATSSGLGKTVPVNNGSYSNQSFEQRRKQVLQQPRPTVTVAPVVTTPTPAPAQPSFLQKTSSSALNALGNIKESVSKKVKGFFTPSGGTQSPIYQKPTKLVSPIVTEEQAKQIGSLKIGDKIPDFTPDESLTSGSSAKLAKGGKLSFGNILDGLFTKPAEFIQETKSFIKSSKAEGQKIIDSTQTKPDPGTNILRGMYKAWQDPQDMYGDQYKPANSDEKLGKTIAKFGIDAILYGNLRGVFEGPETGAIIKGAIETSPAIAKITSSLESFGKGLSKKINVFTESLKDSKFTLKDLSDVTRNVSTPEQLAEFKRLQNFAQENGVDFVQLVKDNTTKTNQKKTLYSFFKNLGNKVTKTFENITKSSKNISSETKLLPEVKGGSAVFSPEQARELVVGSNLENTSLGKKLIKSSFEAEDIGKDLKIDLSLNKEDGVKTVLDLKTPNGVAVTDISYVDKVQQSQEATDKILPEPAKSQTSKDGVIVSETQPSGTDTTINTTGRELTPVEKQQIKQQEVTNTLREEILSGSKESERLDVKKNIDSLLANSPELKLDNPTGDTQVTVYRAGKGEIESGDYVTISKENAEKYLSQRPGTEIQSTTVPLKDLVTTAIKKEMIYFPKSENDSIQLLKQEADRLLSKPEMTSDELNKYSKIGDAIKLEDDIKFFTKQIDKAREAGQNKYISETQPILDKKNKELSLLKSELGDIYDQTNNKIKPKVTQTEALPSPTKTTPPPSTSEAKIQKKSAIGQSRGVVQSPEEINKDLRDFYRNADPEKLGQAQYEVWSEMEIAEAGKKVFAQGDYSSRSEFVGYQKSTFPDWVPEELRRKELFDKVMSGISDLENITYPDSSKPRLQKLYDAILDEIDDRAGINTSEIRESIIKNYETQKQTKSQKPVSRSVARSEPEKSQVTQKEKGSLGFNPKNLDTPFSSQAKNEVEKIVRQSEIAKMLSEKLGVPFRRGKFRSGNAIGIYKHGPKVVRLKRGGLQTVFHETAHFLDDTVGFSKNISESERDNLVQEYNDPLKDLDTRRKEAFAEYMRFKMTGQTEKIAQWSPEFDKMFNKEIEKYPDIKDVIEVATKDFKRWSEQPAVSKVLSHIAVGGQPEASLKDRASKWLHNLYTSALDDLHPLEEFSKLAEKNVGKISAGEDPYILARNLRGWVGKAELFLNKGTFGKKYWIKDENGKTKINFNGKSYSEIMKPIEKAGLLDEFRAFIVSERIVNDLAPRNILTGIDPEDAKTALEQLTKEHPEFVQISKERRDYKDRLLEFASENGLIGPEGLKSMRELNKYHVPFYRVMEETGAKFLGKTKVAGNISSPIKKIKGSEREIIDPLESDIKDTYAIINASERNNVGVAMANLSKRNFELGRLFEEVSAPMKGTTVNVKEVLDKALKGTGAENIALPEELANTAVTLFRPTYASGPNMLNVNMGDKQKVFEVDSDLFKAIQGLNIEDVGTIMKILSFPAKALRAGATLSPDFSVRNPLRDQFTAYVYSKYGFTPGLDLVRGIFELYKKGDVYDLWKAGGGEHATFVSLDRQNLQESLDKALKDPTIANTVVDFVKNPLKILQILSELGEAGTRLGEMRNALAKGADPIASAFASRNITMDFARIGTTTKGINSIIPFTNANVQSTDSMIRNFKNRPFQSLFKSLLSLTLPSVLLYLANREDPRWKEIPQWQKNLFWIVLTPDHIWRIPKPFELGSLFASLPERIMEVIDTKDPTLFDGMKRTIAEGFTPGFMPTFMQPIVENLANYSFFYDRPIVGRGQENLPAPQQFGPYTTEFSKILGESLDYSPAKIDNLINGYFGGIGKYSVQAIDEILKGTGIVTPPVEPAKSLSEMPVIKAFMIKDPIGSSSESVNRVYNLYNESTKKLNYAKKLVKEGQAEQAKEYIRQNPDTLDSVILSGAFNTFSEMNKAVNMIKESNSLTAEQKKEKITQLGKLQVDVAQRVLKQLEKK